MDFDYYQILGLSQTATSYDIKKAYRKLSKAYHPDLHPQTQKAYYEVKFKELQEAYATLSDSGKRSFYDWQLSNKHYESQKEQNQQAYTYQYQQTNQNPHPKPSPSSENNFYGVRPMIIILVIVFGVSFIANSWIDDAHKRLIIEQYNDLDELPPATPFTKIMPYVEAYDYVNFFKEGRAYVLKDDKYGFIDEDGNTITEIKYDWVTNFRDGFAIVQIGQKYGYVNLAGEEVTPVHYDWAERFYRDMALVERANNYAFINTSGEKLFDVKYDAIGRFSEGLASFLQYNGWGYIDQTGKQIIPARYDRAYPFREGLAAVQYQGKWGYIDQSGQMVIPFVYKAANSFSGDRARVTLSDDRRVEVDKLGRVYYNQE